MQPPWQLASRAVRAINAVFVVITSNPEIAAIVELRRGLCRMRKRERQKCIRPDQSSSSSSSSSRSPELPTGGDGRRRVAMTAPQGGADIPVCAGGRGQAGMPAPHCPACHFRPSRLPCNSPLTRPPSTSPDPRQPPSKQIADGIAPHHHPACAPRSNLRTSAHICG